MNKYFMAAEEGEKLDIVIYGDITSWEWLESDVSSYTLSMLISESSAREIIVHINSYGGEVSEGLAIYNALKNHSAQIKTVCDGFACSAASVVFMAGDERIMNEASLLMIHNAWTWASGNAEELRKQADDLDIISKTVAKAYEACVSIPAEELKALLDAESWISPENALEMGFATSIRQESAGSGQQYSAKAAIIRQLAEGKPCGADRKGKPGEEDPPDVPADGFRKLFDAFHKKTHPCDAEQI